MNERLRRILLITGFVVVVLGMFYAIYLIFFKSSGQQGNGNANTSNINGLPVPGNGNINRVSNNNTNGLPTTNTVVTTPDQTANGGPTIVQTMVKNATSSPIVTTSGDLAYYDRPTGKFFRLGPDGITRTLMTDAVYKDVQSISWDPAGSKAVLGFPDGTKIMYDFNSKKQTKLASELDNFTFSPDGNSLASKFLDSKNPDNQWLMVSKPDGTGAQSVEQLGENASKVNTVWSPRADIVATYEKAISANSSEIIFLGQNGENLPSATINGRGFVPNWSPDGNRMLFSTYSEDSDNAPMLSIMDGTTENVGKNIVELDISTRADKCVFSQDNHTVYCAVPYYPVANSGPVPSLGYSVPDNIYAIDLLRGSSTLIAKPVNEQRQLKFTIGKLKLSADESYLYFTDANTDYLDRIALR